VTFLEADGLDELGGARGLSRVSLLDSPSAGATPTGEASTREDPEPEGGEDNGEILMLPEPQTPQTGREVRQGTSDAPRELDERTEQRGESEDGNDPSEVQKESRRYNLGDAQAFNANENVERYKGRDVAKGFKQKNGVDYEEVFAPVSRHPTVRALLAVAVVRDREIKQLDIKMVFVNGDLEEEIWCDHESR
jgi:hypothetical protein